MPDGLRIDELIAHGRESAGHEYKQSAPWPSLRLQIVKAALAFANTRGGGCIVIGMRRLDGDRYEPEGMTTEHLAGYTLDTVQRRVNRYAAPAVSLDATRHEYDGKTFFVIAVDEFRDVPVICRRDEGDVLRQATIYARSVQQVSSAPIDNETDMRALLDLATEKALAARFSELGRAGVRFVLPSTDEFAQEWEDLR